MTFSVLIYLLIQSELRHLDTLCLDREYKGHESLIKKYLIEVIRRSGHKNIPVIYFSEIGKKSPAHKLAINTYRKQQKPTYIATAKDLVKWIL
jgi:predicted transcriptional regulator with HTH domain